MHEYFETNNMPNASLRTKKGVKFADKEEVHQVLRRRSQISRQSITGIWFGEEDFGSFVDDVQKSINKIEQGKRLKDKKYSALGLECLTEEGGALRQAEKEYAWDMVLWEQAQQEKEGTQSDLQLADAYREASRDSAVRAVRLARQVSGEVLEDYVMSGFDSEGSIASFMSLSDDEFDADLPRTKPIKVRFAEEPEVHKVIKRRSQISSFSKTKIWFGEEDFNAFKDEISATVDKIEQGEQLEEDQETLLGVETGEGHLSRHEVQINAWDAVLREQADQLKEGITSPFQISRACREVSKESVLDAASRAADLAREVSDEIYQADDSPDDYVLK